MEYEEAVVPDMIYFPQFGNGTGFFSQITQSAIDSNEATNATGDIQTGSVTVTSDKPLFGVIVFGGDFGLAGVGSSDQPSNSLVGPTRG